MNPPSHPPPSLGYKNKPFYFSFSFLFSLGLVVVGGIRRCRISLLTDFEDAASYLDWTVGTHGIQISFAPPPSSSHTPASDAPSPLSSSISLVAPRLTMPARTLSATYLPEVAPDQGWDRIDAVDSAIRKAGWDGRISEDLRRSIRVRRYQSRKCIVGWDEFVEWRAERGAPVDLDAFEGL